LLLGDFWLRVAAVIEVRYQRGLYLPELDLWLDPQGARASAFVSHAHADHFARHQSVLCSERTSVLLQKRFGLAQNRVESVALRESVVREGFRLRLLPAGHIPGSAMLHVTRLADNASLLYTGDFKMRRSRISEEVSLMAADTLIIESTFGLPGYEFPGAMEVEAQVLRFVQDAFDDGETPVLLAYSLGKAQEALALLTEHGIPVLLHRAAAEMTIACRDVGVEGLPEPLVFEGHAAAGHVVIAAPHAVRTRLFRGLRSMRVAMLSGWAVEPGAAFRYRADAMIAFSDHADHSGLMECIRRVRPRRVLTVHGFAREFAAELRAGGMDAWSAEGGDQLELRIESPATRKGTAKRAPWHKRPACGFADLSDVCRLVGETGSRVGKVRFLTSYLAGLPDDEALAAAVDLFFLGFRRSGGRASGDLLDSTSLKRVLTSLPGVSAGRVREAGSAGNRLLGSVRKILQEIPLQPEVVDLVSIRSFVVGVGENSGLIATLEKLGGRLVSLHPSEGESLVRILSGELGVGLDVDLLVEAFAKAFGVDSDRVKQAFRGCEMPGDLAVHARHGRLAEVLGSCSVEENPDSEVPDRLPELSLPLAID
jgi:DNA ligase-1